MAAPPSLARRAFLIFAALAAASAAAPAAPREARPNILLFIADNWAWPHAGALGDPMAHTPVFDRIAREGVVFDHAFCPVPSCSPTRSSLLTGRPAHQLGEAASLWSGFPRGLRVFTEHLRAAGYEVGSTGKGWGPGQFLESGWPENPAGRTWRSPEEFMASRDRAKPFFLWVGNTDTSRGRWPTDPEGQAGLDAARLRVPPQFPDSPEVRASLLAYYAGVRNVDRAAGAAVALLEAAGALDDTVVIYTSDNGWQFPRGLANCYDTGTRIPLAIRWGKKLAAGRREAGFVSLTDFAPFFLELAGVPPPAEMTGRSFLPALLDRPGAARADHVFLERERHANVRAGDLSYPIRALRTRDHLYIWNLRPDRWPAGDPKMHVAVGDYGDVDPTALKDFIVANARAPGVARFFDLSFAKRPAEELYDLRRDPAQLENVAGRPEHAAAQRALRARVEQWMRDTTDPRVDPAYDAWDRYPYYGGGPRVPGGAGKKKAK